MFIIQKRKHRTHEEYVEELKSKNYNIEVVDQFINTITKIKHKCKIDGYEFYATPHDILSKNRIWCPRCIQRINREKRTKQNYYVGQRILDKKRDITITNVEHAVLNDKHKIWKYQYKCNKCGYDCGMYYTNGIMHEEYWITQDSLNTGKGCACCANRIVSPQINSIFAQQEIYGWMFKYFPDADDTKKYSPNYSKKIPLVCPECGREKNIALHTLNEYGFGCICGDGISYPEKFMFNVLEQANISFDYHKYFQWSKNTNNGKKEYDFFIPAYNMIIETHGEQHYKDTLFARFERGKTLKEQKANDKFKKILALSNGIDNYIEINCSKSDYNFIKQSIINSNLLTILNVSDTCIDWELANSFATSNLVKNAAILWNNGYTILEISNILKLHETTIRSYLRKSNELNWCKYPQKA